MKLPFSLNQAQLQAVTASGAHLLINAAAGTGKTSTIAARIVHLQAEHGIPPSGILAVSFSRAAKSQISEKVESICRSVGSGSPVRTYTFHGLAFRILRFAAEIGETWLRPGFTIIETDTDNLNRIYSNYAAELFSNLNDDFVSESRPCIYSKALDMVRQGSANLGVVALNPTDLPENSSISVSVDTSARVSVSTGEIRRVWQGYQKYLRKHNCMDYPGLITEAVKVLSVKTGYTVRRVRDGLRHIIVDEYQDTSKAQEALLLALAGDSVYVTAVGDNDQTIYTFNGSDISNILDFGEHFRTTGLPVSEAVNLTENYRSSANILTLANRVINKTQRPFPKRLEPARGFAPEPVASYRKENLSVTLINTPRIELAADFTANEIRRLLGEGIDAGEIAVLVRKDSEYAPQATLVRQMLEQYGINEVAGGVDSRRRAIIEDTARNLCQYHYDESLKNVLEQLWAGELDHELDGTGAEEIIPVLQKLLDTGAAYAYEAAEMLYDNGENSTSDMESGGIRVSTVHSAKGKEFRVVFLLYLGDRSFPHGVTPDTDEERRLLYVGITRAQERIYLIGRPGVHGPDFLGDCYGTGVVVKEYTVPGGREAEGLTGLSEIEVASVEKARRKQAEEEARRQAELEKMFDEEDWL